jgi:alkylhydroperoxidase family enzyme
MATHTRIPPAEMTGPYAAIVKRMSRKVFGEVPRWRESAVFTPLERDVMDYAEAMSQTPTTVTDELSARLLGELGPAGLIELTATIGLVNLYARTNIALGVESQGFSAACELEPLAVASGV